MHCFPLISFESELGWMGILINEGMVYRIRFGFRTELQLLKNFDEFFDVRRPNKRIESVWVQKLKEYASGKVTNLIEIPVDMSDYSPFQTKVLQSCRQIPYGATMSYGRLADLAKFPNAARAVGTTMKKNRFPLVVPCHRVVASNGIGGYSAGAGVRIKRRLLALEGVEF